MREPVTQITLRVSAETEQRLVRFCEHHGVSRRAAFEAVTTVALVDEEDPTRRHWILEMWALARRLDDPAFRSDTRSKVIARMSPELAAQFKEACQVHGVSQNAALTMLVAPWPRDDTPIFTQHRAEILDRVVGLARHLDHERRRGHKPPHRTLAAAEAEGDADTESDVA